MAEFCQAPPRAPEFPRGEFSEPIKRGPAATARARGRDGKNPAADGAPARLFYQGKQGVYQAAEAPFETASSPPQGAPELALSTPEAGVSLGVVAAPPGAVTSEVTSSHAREVSTQVSSAYARGAVETTARVLGVDIGNSGGLALVTSTGDLVDVAPMPVLADGPKGRPTVNGPLLAALVRRWAPTAAYVELVGPRPGEAAGGAFSFGRARGLVEGVLAAQGVPARMVTAPVWKRHVGIPAGRDGVKDLARAEACRRWPGHADRFAAKGSDGLAEAGLIAVAGMAREARG